MTITTKEYNVKNNTAELWNYVLENGQVKSSSLLMSVPFPAWADRHEVMGCLIDYALDKGVWERGL